MNWKDEIIKGIEPSGFFKELENKKQNKMKEEECKDCFGTGTRERDVSEYIDITPQYEEVKCWECNGQGYIEVEED